LGKRRFFSQGLGIVMIVMVTNLIALAALIVAAALGYSSKWSSLVCICMLGLAALLQIISVTSYACPIMGRKGELRSALLWIGLDIQVVVYWGDGIESSIQDANTNQRLTMKLNRGVWRWLDKLSKQLDGDDHDETMESQEGS
jgi:hypothetical protein